MAISYGPALSTSGSGSSPTQSQTLGAPAQTVTFSGLLGDSLTELIMHINATAGHATPGALGTILVNGSAVTMADHYVDGTADANATARYAFTNGAGWATQGRIYLSTKRTGGVRMGRFDITVGGSGFLYRHTGGFNFNNTADQIVSFAVSSATGNYYDTGSKFDLYEVT